MKGGGGVVGRAGYWVEDAVVVGFGAGVGLQPKVRVRAADVRSVAMARCES